MMHTVFDQLNTLGVYLKSKYFHWVSILEGEFYAEGGFILKASSFTKELIVSSLKFANSQQLRRQNIDQITENS